MGFKMEFLTLKLTVAVCLLAVGSNAGDKSSFYENMDENGDRAHLIIRHREITTWGDMGKWDKCPPGTFAAGFRLKTQASQGDGDDTALNAIKLYCNTLGESKLDKQVSSLKGQKGSWGHIFRCTNGVLLGFKMRVESPQGPKTYFHPNDDTAANNIQFVCSGATIANKTQTLEGDGLSYGNWDKQISYCPMGHAICAIKTQVELKLNPKDNEPYNTTDMTGLNNVRFGCCEVPNNEENCEKEENWATLVECENRGPSDTKPAKCSYKAKAGEVSMDFNSMKKSEQISYNIKGTGEQKVDFKKLSATFKESVEFKSLTSDDWTAMQTSTVTNEKEHTAEFQVRVGQKVAMQQLQGVCGPFSLFTTKVRYVKVNVDENGNEIGDKEVRPLNGFPTTNELLENP